MVYLQCGKFRARLCTRLVRRKVVPQETNEVAATEKIQAANSHPTEISTSTASEGAPERDDSRTPEALNQVVDEFVGYEIKKIKALAVIENDMLAEELMARGATIAEIDEAARKERREGMTKVDS
ncbi:hypothetical protein CHS0354_006503 [Potamilus streckersoni]|uniref:Uncharacterized protein n=1 Tax=Potamilus streckersoni TaxID=2493646 RepID=A0AAE0VG85_9BIVA|nr:hypothetical protein CHS0354_006503 [Potamilus streckersoni]